MKNQNSKPIYRSTLFWISLLLFPVIGIGSGIYASISEGYKLSVSVIGFKNFYDIFQIPLLISGISIPLTALVVSTYRSKQMHDQMQLQLTQNIATNHYSRRAFFISEMLNLSDRHKGLNINYSNLYKRIFPNSRKGDYSTINDINDALENLLRAISAMKSVENLNLYRPGYYNSMLDKGISAFNKIVRIKNGVQSGISGVSLSEDTNTTDLLEKSESLINLTEDIYHFTEEERKDLHVIRQEFRLFKFQLQELTLKSQKATSCANNIINGVDFVYMYKENSKFLDEYEDSPETLLLMCGEIKSRDPDVKKFFNSIREIREQRKEKSPEASTDI